jgi:hypothetical protein
LSWTMEYVATNSTTTMATTNTININTSRSCFAQRHSCCHTLWKDDCFI